MNADGLRIAGVNAAGYIYLCVFAEHGESKHPGHTGYAVVSESDYQARNIVSPECPDKRRPNAIADFAGHGIDRFRKLFVVTQNATSGLVVPAPNGKIIDSYIRHVRNDLFIVGNSVFVHAQLIWFAGGEAYFADRCRPRWTVAQRFDLGVLDKDRVGTQPVSAADCTIQHFRVADVAEVRLGV